MNDYYPIMSFRKQRWLPPWRTWNGGRNVSTLEIKTAEDIETNLGMVQEESPELLEKVAIEKWVSVESVVKLLESKRNISDIAYTHRNEVIDSLIQEVRKNE